MHRMKKTHILRACTSYILLVRIRASVSLSLLGEVRERSTSHERHAQLAPDRESVRGVQVCSGGINYLHHAK